MDKNQQAKDFFGMSVIYILFMYAILSFVSWDFNMWRWSDELLRVCIVMNIFGAFFCHGKAKEMANFRKAKADYEEEVSRRMALTRCPNDDGHHPCNYCTAKSPNDIEACCRVTEE